MSILFKKHIIDSDATQQYKLLFPSLQHISPFGGHAYLSGNITIKSDNVEVTNHCDLPNRSIVSSLLLAQEKSSPYA